MANLLMSNDTCDDTFPSCANSTSNQKDVTVHDIHVTANIHQYMSHELNHGHIDSINKACKNLSPQSCTKQTTQDHTASLLSRVSQSELCENESINNESADHTKSGVNTKKMVNNLSSISKITMNESNCICTSCHKGYS